jgi:hypothetical protein
LDFIIAFTAPEKEGQLGTLVDSLEFLLNADEFFVHCLVAIRAGTHFNGCGYAGCTEVMHSFVAPPNGGKNVIPIPRNICAVRVQMCF